jgi:hypothetical protein
MERWRQQEWWRQHQIELEVYTACDLVEKKVVPTKRPSSFSRALEASPLHKLLQMMTWAKGPCSGNHLCLNSTNARVPLTLQDKTCFKFKTNQLAHAQWTAHLAVSLAFKNDTLGAGALNGTK